MLNCKRLSGTYPSKLVQQQVSEVANLPANRGDALPRFARGVECFQTELRVLHELAQAHN